MKVCYVQTDLSDQLLCPISDRIPIKGGVLVNKRLLSCILPHDSLEIMSEFVDAVQESEFLAFHVTYYFELNNSPWQDMQKFRLIS